MTTVRFACCQLAATLVVAGAAALRPDRPDHLQLRPRSGAPHPAGRGTEGRPPNSGSSLGALDPATIFPLDPAVSLLAATYDGGTDQGEHAYGGPSAGTSCSCAEPARGTPCGRRCWRWTRSGFATPTGPSDFRRPGRPRFPADVVIVEPTVHLSLTSTKALPSLGLGYFTEGASWQASYQVILGGKDARVAGNAVVQSSTLSVSDAEVQLLAGDVGSAPSDQMMARSARQVPWQPRHRRRGPGATGRRGAPLHRTGARHAQSGADLPRGLVRADHRARREATGGALGDSVLGRPAAVRRRAGRAGGGDLRGDPSAQDPLRRHAGPGGHRAHLPGGRRRAAAAHRRVVARITPPPGQPLELDAGTAFDLTAKRTQTTYSTTRDKNGAYHRHGRLPRHDVPTRPTPPPPWMSTRSAAATGRCCRALFRRIACRARGCDSGSPCPPRARRPSPIGSRPPGEPAHPGAPLRPPFRPAGRVGADPRRGAVAADARAGRGAGFGRHQPAGAARRISARARLPRRVCQAADARRSLVPGNHDVEWWKSPFGIFGRRVLYEKYRTYFGEELTPVLRLPGLVVAGAPVGARPRRRLHDLEPARPDGEGSSPEVRDRSTHRALRRRAGGRGQGGGAASQRASRRHQPADGAGALAERAAAARRHRRGPWCCAGTTTRRGRGSCRAAPSSARRAR